DGETHRLDAKTRHRFEEIYREHSAQGARILAVAFADVTKKDSYRASDEKDLVLAGLLAFDDPVREDAADAIKSLERDGVRVKIITGDNELVAKHLCEQVGLDGSQILMGEDVDRMEDRKLAREAEKVTVFARLSPEQKNRVILALKKRG